MWTLVLQSKQFTRLTDCAQNIRRTLAGFGPRIATPTTRTDTHTLTIASWR